MPNYSVNKFLELSSGYDSFCMTNGHRRDIYDFSIFPFLVAASDFRFWLPLVVAVLQVFVQYPTVYGCVGGRL
jgi:hypothetical protein